MRLIRILLTTLVVLVIGLVVLVVALPDEKIAKIATDQVKTYTGRDLTLEGKVGISWYPVFGVSTGPVSLSNADWSQDGPMFRAESAAIGVDVMSLIGGDIRLTRIELIKPDVLLQTHADGRTNWDLLPPSEPAGAETETPSKSDGGGFILENLVVQGASLRFVEAGAESFALANVDAQLAWPGPQKPAEVSLTLRPVGQEVRLSSTVGNLEALLQGKVSEINARLQAAGADITFEGRAGLAPQLGGKLDASVPDLNKFMAALGQPGAGIDGPAAIRGAITYTKDGLITLRDGSLTALGNSLSAQADVDIAGAKPVVTAQFVAGKLDLNRFAGADSGAGNAAEVSDGWSKTLIDASGLAAIDGEIALAAEAIDLGGLKLDRSRMTVKIDNARAVVSLNELNAYDGVVTGQFVANNRSGLSVGGKMNIAGMELNGLLQDAMDVSSFTGKADVQFSFLGSGASTHAIMNSLQGDATLKVGQGTITGLDLEKLMRGNPGGGLTVFDALTGSAEIEQGVLKNDDLLLELSRVIAKGEGQIGLGARNINYLITPQLRSNDESGLAIPVRIKGSWDNPSIRPDLEKALGIDLDAKKEELKEEAKAAVKEKLSEELGVTSQGEAKDAVKDALEDEAKNALRKLLKIGD